MSCVSIMEMNAVWTDFLAQSCKHSVLFVINLCLLAIQFIQNLLTR
jgi:hypothetical protein